MFFVGERRLFRLFSLVSNYFGSFRVVPLRLIQITLCCFGFFG